MPTLTLEGGRATEGDYVIFTLRLSEPALDAVTVDYATVGGSADRDQDLTDYSSSPLTGTVTFAAGETVATVRMSTAVQYPATRRSKIRPRGGDRRHGARAYQIAGACHGALAPWAKTAPSDFRTFVAAFGQCCWRDDNSRRSSRGC